MVYGKLPGKEEKDMKSACRGGSSWRHLIKYKINVPIPYTKHHLVVILRRKISNFIIKLWDSHLQESNRSGSLGDPTECFHHGGRRVRMASPKEGRG